MTRYGLVFVKVLVPVGFGTEEMDAVIIIDILRRAGAHVTVASVEPNVQIKCSSGTKLIADTLISTCAEEIFDLVVLPVWYLFLADLNLIITSELGFVTPD